MHFLRLPSSTFLFFLFLHFIRGTNTVVEARKCDCNLNRVQLQGPRPAMDRSLPESSLVPDDDATLMVDTNEADVILTPTGNHINLGTVSFDMGNSFKGDKGEPGYHGPAGFPGRTGPPGMKGEKGESGGVLSFEGPLSIQFATPSSVCDDRNIGSVRFDEYGEFLEVCTDHGWRSISDHRRDRRLSKSCLDVLLRGNHHGNGIYWINPFNGPDSKHAIQVFCDLTTAGGGWTLVARITHDYEWACPDKLGSMCGGSSTNPEEAYLFHDVHARDFVNLTALSGRESAVHLQNSFIRQLFTKGRQQIRFSFVSDNGVPDFSSYSEDGYATFIRNSEERLFMDNTEGQMYTQKDGHYTWDVITHQRKDKVFRADVICWGNQSPSSHRYHEGGLHMGVLPSLKGEKPCVLASNSSYVMLKGLYIYETPDGEANWLPRSFGILHGGQISAANERIALWVR